MVVRYRYVAEPISYPGPTLYCCNYSLTYTFKFLTQVDSYKSKNYFCSSYVQRTEREICNHGAKSAIHAHTEYGTRDMHVIFLNLYIIICKIVLICEYYIH